MARKFPRQVARIYILNLSERPLGIERSTRAFRRVPPENVQAFRQAEEISAELE